MLQRFSVYTQNLLYLRTILRVQTLILCVCLLAPLALYEPGFGASSSAAGTVLAGPSSHGGGAAVRLDFLAHRLPLSLTQAPSLTPVTGLRSGVRDDFSADSSLSDWAAAIASLCLPSLRIDPIAWDSRTPSFLLPSAHGLVSFAIPPPLYLV